MGKGKMIQRGLRFAGRMKNAVEFSSPFAGGAILGPSHNRSNRRR